MVGKEDVVNAVALNSAIFNGARVMGPAIGAVVLAWAGPGLAFMLNGVSYIAVIYGLVLMQVAPAVAASRSGGSMHQIAEGLRYVARHETIAVLAGLVGVISLFAFPYTTLMPIFADSILHVGSQGYGTLMMFTGIGSLAGALSLAFQSSRPGVRRGRIVLVGAVGMPVFLAAFSSSTNYALSLALLTGVGWTMISVNATVNSIIQTLVPDELRGRVMGVYSLMAVGIAPLGSLQAGLIADTLGSPAAVLIGSVVTASAVVWILLVRRVAFNVH
jgi:predicted MFS family arabinose efflux permease